ncbi:MAG: hypothetical protein SynsKO_35940 [Synoicihabitans sp.]
MFVNFVRTHTFRRVSKALVRRAETKRQELGRNPRFNELGSVQLVGWWSRLWLALIGGSFLWLSGWFFRNDSMWLAGILGPVSAYVAWRGLVGHTLDIRMLFFAKDGDEVFPGFEDEFEPERLARAVDSTLMTHYLSFVLIEFFLFLICAVVQGIAALLSALAAAVS